MRNHLYLILFLLLGTSSIAAQESVTTINGHTFHVGDSLTIGLPHEPGERYQTIRYSSWEDKEIPAFTKGKLKWSIPTPKRISLEISYHRTPCTSCITQSTLRIAWS